MRVRRFLRLGGAATLVTAVVLSAGLAMADGPRPGAAWPQFKRDGAKSGLSTVNGPSTLVQKWVATTDGGVYGGPVISDDGSVYVVTENLKIMGFQADGTRKFSVTPADVSGKFTHPVVNARGLIAFGTEDGYVIAVNGSGSEIWRYDTRNAPYGSESPQTIVGAPAVASNYSRMLVPTYGGNVYELDDGVFAGVRRADGSVRAGAAVAPDGTVVWATLDRSVFGGFSTGGDKFRTTVDGAVLTTPAISSNNVIYVPTEAGSVYAIQTDGTRKWNVKLGTGRALRGSPAIGPDGTVYVGSDDGNLYALDPSTGAQKWAFSTGGAITGAPAVGPNGLIYVGSTDRSLYVLTTDGKQQSSVRTDGAIDLSSPAIASDGTLYIGSRDGRLYAYRDGGAPAAQATSTVAAAAPTATLAPPAATATPTPAPGPVISTAPVQPSGQGVYFPETGHNVRGPILDFYNANGGLTVFGYPRTEEITLADGRVIQWFQRARVEYTPATGLVQLGLLGDELLVAMGALR